MRSNWIDETEFRNHNRKSSKELRLGQYFNESDELFLNFELDDVALNESQEIFKEFFTTHIIKAKTSKHLLESKQNRT